MLDEVDGGSEGLLDRTNVGQEVWDFLRRRAVAERGGFTLERDAVVDDVLPDGICGPHVVAYFGVETGEFFCCDVGFMIDGVCNGLCFLGGSSMGLSGGNELGNKLKIVFHV